MKNLRLCRRIFIVKTAQPGDHILVMSNGGFGGIHDKLLSALDKKAEQATALLD